MVSDKADWVVYEKSLQLSDNANSLLLSHCWVGGIKINAFDFDQHILTIKTDDCLCRLNIIPRQHSSPSLSKTPLFLSVLWPDSSIILTNLVSPVPVLFPRYRLLHLPLPTMDLQGGFEAHQRVWLFGRNARGTGSQIQADECHHERWSSSSR